MSRPRSLAARLPALDGLRGLAACSVLFFHVWRYSTPIPAAGLGVPALDGFLSHLWVGVTMFFVLSGYLLLRPFVEFALGERESFPRLWRYGESRFLRIVPGYWTALAGCLLLVFKPDVFVTAIVVFPIAVGVIGGRLIGRRIVPVVALAAACALAELVLVAPPLGATAFKSMFFLQIYVPSPTIIGPAWTLCVEAAFYLALPLVGGLLAIASAPAPRWARRWVCIGIIGLLAAIGPVYRTAMLHDPSLPPALPACADQFAVGGIVAVFMSGSGGLSRFGRRCPWVFAALAAVVLAVTLLVVSAPREPVRSAWFDGGVAVAFGLVLLAVLNGWKAGTTALASNLLVSLGTISYGVYLWHEPLIHFAQRHELIAGTAWTFLPTAVAVLGVTSVVAAAQWRWVEAPSLRLKRAGIARAHDGVLAVKGFWLSWPNRIATWWSGGSATTRLQFFIGGLAVAVITGALVVRVPEALTAASDTHRLATQTSSTIDRELATGDAIGFDHTYQLEAVTLIPPGSTFAVLGPPSRAIGLKYYAVNETMFDVLPGYFRYLLFSSREVPARSAGYILCYGCDTSPWDRRTEWLYRNPNGELIGRVRGP